MPKARVDQDLCIGCGACISACPECFEFNEDGKAHVVNEECTGCDLEEVALNCPAQAITVGE